MRALACSGPEQHGHSVLSMPIAHLAGFRGVLQVDGYGGYKVMAERGEVRLAFCWSHVRRRLYELASAGPAPIASEALIRIADLYRIESEIRGRSAAERRTIRQEQHPISCPGIRALAARETRAGQPKEHACRGDPISRDGRG